MENAPAGLKEGDKVKLSNGLNARVTKIDQVCTESSEEAVGKCSRHICSK
jgi:preprotein translocase subunit YajC